MDGQSRRWTWDRWLTYGNYPDMWAGEWLIVTRYASWEAYGTTQDAVAKDEAFAKLYAHTATFAELMGRDISVGVDF